MHIEDRVITLNLWDTAGQEKFKSLIPGYIKDSQTIVIVYDITNRESFESIEKKWMADARELRTEGEAMVVLAGNKADLGEQARQVTEEEGLEFAKEKGVMFFEISALSGQNI